MNQLLLVINLLLAAMLQTADIITTKIALKMGAYEANPIMAPIVDKLTHVILVKLLCVGLIGYLFYRSIRQNHIQFQVACLGHHIILMAVILNNLFIMNFLAPLL